MLKKQIPKKERTFLDGTVTVLLVVAVVISVIGTILSFSKLTNVDVWLTGSASSTQVATANITISSTTSITNQVANINFGSGYLNASCATCIMDTDKGANLSGPCCISFSNLTSGFLLENTGNENISINYSCSGQCNASDFIGGINPRFELKATRNSVALQSGESGAADTVASCRGQGFNGWNITINDNLYNVSNVSLEQVYRTVTSNGAWLCGNASVFPLNFANAADAGVIDLNVTIPQDAQGGRGQQNVTITFNAISAG